MNTFFIIFYFTFITFGLHADVKWIPIEPIKPIEPITITQTKKQDKNISQNRPTQGVLENLKAIQYMLESTKDKEGLEADFD